MKFKTTTSVILALGLFTSAMPQAQAFQNGEGCELKQTRDGFVALRSGPSAKSKLRHKLLEGIFRVFPTEKNYTWVYVSTAISEASGVPASQDWSGEGYVKSNLIDWSSCSNAG
jgi:hypothetical protein